MQVRRFVYIFFVTVAYNICHVQNIWAPSYRVTTREAPFMAYVSRRPSYCGAVILSAEVVLTAGHCIRPQMTIIAGGNPIYPDTGYPDSQTIDVQKSLLHENYLLSSNGVQAYNDIALLLLETPLKLNPYVQPIKWSNILDFNKTVTIYGWGSTDAFVNRPSHSLRSKNISLIPDNLCIELLSKATTKCDKQVYEICAEKSACVGDSGGPMVQIVGNVTKLIGISSWGADDNVNCDTAPVVYEHVGYFSDWIQAGIRSLLYAHDQQNIM